MKLRRSAPKVAALVCVLAASGLACGTAASTVAPDAGAVCPADASSDGSHASEASRAVVRVVVTNTSGVDRWLSAELFVTRGTDRVAMTARRSCPCECTRPQPETVRVSRLRPGAHQELTWDGLEVVYEPRCIDCGGGRAGMDSVPHTEASAAGSYTVQLAVSRSEPQDCSGSTPSQAGAEAGDADADADGGTLAVPDAIECEEGRGGDIDARADFVLPESGEVAVQIALP